MGLHKGMGSGYLSKSPHLTNTVGIEKEVRWRKPVIGEDLRRQSFSSLEMRVGRPTVNDRIIAKNGYGDVLPVFQA